MKKIILFLSLGLTVGLPLQAQADTKLLVEYDGATHTVVKALTVPTREVPQPKRVDKDGQETILDSKSLPQNHILISWESAKGTAATVMEDPRLVRAPLTDDGQGHGAFVTRETGAYVLTLKGDDIDLDTVKLTFPGAQTSQKLNYASDLD